MSLSSDNVQLPFILGKDINTILYVKYRIYIKIVAIIDIIGERDTLADIGQTAADFFNKKLPDNGKSFLESIV